MWASIRVSHNRPYTLSAYDKGKGEITFIELRILEQDKLQIVSEEMWILFSQMSCRSYINVQQDIRQSYRVQKRYSLCGTDHTLQGICYPWLHLLSAACSPQWPRSQQLPVTFQYAAVRATDLANV